MVKSIKSTAVVMVALMASALAVHAEDAMPTVKLMVGGIDKQIYLPYQLAQGLGYYKKYGVNVELSTETAGGVGAEDAVASGEVEMAGAWYVHTIDFQMHGKKVIGIVQLSGAPGEREMCAKGANIKTPSDWKGKAVGVTDIGSGTDDLTLYMAARDKLTSKDFTRVSVGAGATLIAALQHGKIVCGMTTQPTVNAIEKKGIGYSAFDLASTDGATKWLGGTWPTASVLARADWVEKNKATTQKVVNALVATMHYIATHSAADIADHLPPAFTSNPLSTKQEYIDALSKDKGQFLPDGMMPKGGPETVLAVEKAAGKVKGNVDLAATYTDEFVIAANKAEGYTK
ncbi:ABC transporter substrate-binding protein [Allorhizobium sp. BGMRC 0089]|uniref:ABC transporter substrate-binding protein n=1 Tax=Allorhizobium sonneratiae TaxID=2934936 RepID=UPI00203320E0|nr:ABC transporter substrate-binding protein [Allorhizobium sonneratiae]MCM2294641.1 ABC transporter substrate-binding protein [Allorhizobium sonneratiae]